MLINNDSGVAGTGTSVYTILMYGYSSYEKKQSREESYFLKIQATHLFHLMNLLVQ